MEARDVKLMEDVRGRLLAQLQGMVEGRELEDSQELRVQSQEPEDFSGSRLLTLDSRLSSDPRLSSGVPAIDRLLPGGGLAPGMLVEWVGGSGVEEQWSRGAASQKTSHYFTTPLLHCSTSATALSLLAAREACREGGVLVMIDRAGAFYPPAAVAWGVDLQRLIVVRPASARDQLWAAVESLRSPAVAAMWTAIDRLDDRAFRRLQLAAQAQRAVGLLVRPASAIKEPSWADVKMSVEGSRARGESRAKSQESRAGGVLTLGSHRWRTFACCDAGGGGLVGRLGWRLTTWSAWFGKWRRAVGRRQ